MGTPAPVITSGTAAVTVNGTQITSSAAITVVWQQIAVQVSGPFRITSRTTQPRFISVQSVPSVAVVGPTAVSWDKSTAFVLPPGQHLDVGAPPAGQVWLVAIISPAQESRLAWLGVVSLAAVFGLASYGAFELVTRTVKEVRRRLDRDRAAEARGSRR
jgi:hypothetical protein